MDLRDIRTIFYGTSTFGIPAAEWLLKNTNLVAVITTPDKPVGREQEFLGSSVKQWARDNKDLNILQPEGLKDEGLNDVLADLSPDLALVADYGKIIPGTVLDIPKYKTLNLHVSLLPKYRGASPMQTAILNGEKVSGVTLFVLEPKLDTGPIIAQKEIVLEPEENFETLHKKSASLSAELLNEYLEPYVGGEIKPKPQDHSQATYTKIFSKEDGRIDWQKSAEQIERMIRALNPWPGTWSNLVGLLPGDKTKLVKIFQANLSDKELSPGETFTQNDKLFVGTGDGALEVHELQIEGGKRLTTSQFLKGVRNKITFT